MIRIFYVHSLMKSFIIGRMNVECSIPKIKVWQFKIIMMPLLITHKTIRGSEREKWKHISLATFSSEIGKTNREWDRLPNSLSCLNRTINLWPKNSQHSPVLITCSNSA